VSARRIVALWHVLTLAALATTLRDEVAS